MANEKVKCNVCGNEYSVRGITRHIKACKAIKKEYSKGYHKYYTLRIRGTYTTDYFLYISAVSHLTLGELDQFLRDIWVECCDHLSCFDYNGEAYNIDGRSGFGIDGENIQLKQLFRPGEYFSYEYDYGSTTELEIEVIDELYGNHRESLIEIFARNNIPEYYLNNEDYPDPINSPRMDVCGYDGPLDRYKDITSWGKNKKKEKPKKKDKTMTRLMELTNEFIKLKPFKVFPSDIIIAIEDPETSIVYYCNILGYDREDYGLNIHIGDYGMAGFFELMQDPNKPDLFQNLHMLSLMIDGHDYLEDMDLEILETYNPLKLHDMYPFFRKSLRGETYRVLESNEIKTMVMVLEGLMEVYKTHKNKVNEMLDHKSRGELLKCNYKSGKIQCTYTEAMPVFQSVEYNEIDIKRVKKHSKMAMDQWEITSIFLPTLTMTDYFPEVIVIQDKISGQILNQVVLEDKKNPIHEAKDLIERTIKKSKKIPMEITTDKKYYFDGLKDLLNKLGAKIYYEPMGEYMVDFANGIYQGQDQEIAEEMLDYLPEDLIEKLMQAGLHNERLDEKTMIEIMKHLDLDLFE